MELVCGPEHFRRVVADGICQAKVSVDVMTADFKAMLVPLDHRAGQGAGRGTGRRSAGGGRGRAESIVEHFRRLADAGVEIRLLHAGVPSSAALQELRRELPERLTIRRCPRLHSKAVIIDSRLLYLGSANLTGAGLGAKADGRRNFEMGVMTEHPDWIDRVSAEFNALWEGRHCAGCGRRDVCPVPLEEPKLAPSPSTRRPVTLRPVVRRRAS